MAEPKPVTGHPASKRQKTDPAGYWDWQGTSESLTNSLCGLLALSTELIDEILSYLKSITNHTSLHDSGSNVPLLEAGYLECTKALRALSQTCVTYRTRFLPMCWWALEACCQGTVNQAWYKHIGEALQSKCTGLTNHPELAQYIHVARIVVTRYKTNMVLPAFVSCLASLTNLHTLHIFHVHSQMTTTLKNAFQGTILPTVRSIMLPGYAHEVLRSCPNVTYVKCICNDGSKLTTVIKESCPNVEIVEGFRPDLSIMKRMVKAIPQLKVIRFQPDVDSASIETLRALTSSKFLQKLEFETATQAGEDFRPGLQQSIFEARKILKASSAAERKVVRVWHRQASSRNTGIYPIYTDVDLD
ncbi:hypothetical protein AX15_004029 [Amanita polypyramis BW_CC]|nr:hypothetical protein AX15_004029 [Amanita polypyramis BW_CC]